MKWIACIVTLISTLCAATLTVTIRDADIRKPVAASVLLYDRANHLRVPDSALDLSKMGYLYAEGALIHYADWTSTRVRSADPFFGSFYFRAQHPPGTACFFVDGGFQIQLEPGPYRLTVRRGLEYTPFEQTIDIQGDRTLAVDLKRWVDMEQRGWYSGDGHVHIERTGPHANAGALLWTSAEDVHVANVLSMGDADQTFYPQYTHAPYCQDQRCLVSGQEEPRTRYLGHTLQIRTADFVRTASTYYSYLPLFESVRRGGGLSGFAHVGRRRWTFDVDRGLSLLLPRQAVDFAEIAQMGYIGVDLWYEFLNLGFHLTAMAGTDVPWGGTIGQTRVYAPTGPRFDVQRWFDAVRQGHTFVTTGPMLDFTVNGMPPGSVIRLKRGQSISVSARAWGDPAGTRLNRLELVSFGRTVKTVSNSGPLEVKTELQPEHSLWITAQCVTNEQQLMDLPGFFSGAVATPVYIEVDGAPAIDREHLNELVAKRMASLDGVAQWVDQGGSAIEPGGTGGRESAAAFEASQPEVRRLLAAARAYYEHLRLAEKSSETQMK